MIQTLGQKIERTQARINALQEEYGSKVVSETELRGLIQRKKILEADLEKLKKESTSIEKQTKDAEKIKAKAARERQKLAEMERKRNIIEERLYSTKRSDELEDDEVRLKRLNEEDQAIIDDINTSEFDKEAARERMADRNDEILRLTERENSLSLRERIKLIQI